MKFGQFYEMQVPRPWTEGAEHKQFHDSLEQVELADKLGLDYAWVPEHHFLEEFSHSSAPEVFLAAASQRTKQIRLGHGIVLMPTPYNPPARVAERLGALDLLSNGRVEFGTGESSTAMEIHGFNVPLADKHAMWEESVEQVCNMMTMTPYPGYQGKHVSMPCRNVVPKPMQKPHPPLWMACTRHESIALAARKGMGALVFSFKDSGEAKARVDEYYRILKTECVPIGHSINPNIAMISGFSCHPDEQEALRRGLDGFRFFGYGLQHYYAYGVHQSGVTNIWEKYENVRKDLPPAGARQGLGTPDQLRAAMRPLADAGVDQVIMIQQGGRNEHQHICEGLELFASDVMPEFKEHEKEREARKLEQLAPFLEQAMARKQKMAEISADKVPQVHAREGNAGRPAAAFGAGLALKK